VTVNNVSDSSTTIEKISFNQIPLYESIDKLSKLANYTFYVDNNKDLHFKEKSTESSGYTFDSGNVINASFSEKRDSIYNKVWFYGGRYLNTTQQEFLGDGAGSVFTLTYNPHNILVTVNDVIQKGNIEGLTISAPSGTNFLVNYYDKQIIFVSGTSLGYNSIPGSNADVFIQYDRELPVVKVGEDAESISKYGEKVKVIFDKDIKFPATAATLVQRELDTSSYPQKEGNLKIQGIVDVTPSQTCIVNLPYHNISNQTYDILEANYEFNKENNISESVVTLKVNKKLNDLTDTVKFILNELRKIQSEDVSIPEVMTRYELSTGSILVRQSGCIVYNTTLTTSGLRCYWAGGDITLCGTLASGTLQRGLFDNGTSVGSSTTGWTLYWSGCFP
jgi:hypothetical protein